MVKNLAKNLPSCERKAAFADAIRYLQQTFCYVFAAYYFYLISFLMYLYVLPVPKNNVQKKE